MTAGDRRRQWQPANKRSSIWNKRTEMMAMMKATAQQPSIDYLCWLFITFWIFVSGEQFSTVVTIFVFRGQWKPKNGGIRRRPRQTKEGHRRGKNIIHSLKTGLIDSIDNAGLNRPSSLPGKGGSEAGLRHQLFRCGVMWQTCMTGILLTDLWEIR